VHCTPCAPRVVRMCTTSLCLASCAQTSNVEALVHTPIYTRAALTAAQDAPLGLTSHFELRAAALCCAAMASHATQQAVQMHGCAALHALARRR